MHIEENDAGGQSVILEAGDDLNEIPASHQMLLTPSLRRAFANPPAYFGEIASRCPFPSMADWLRALVAGGQWDLTLHIGDPSEWSAAGIRWYSDEVQGAEVAPADAQIAPDLPPALQQYAALVGSVSWMPFGYAGGLDGNGPHTRLSEFYYSQGEDGAEVDPERTFILGGTLHGDLLIYTADDQGGWWSHESGTVHLIGSIAQSIEWVYGELRAGRVPEFGSEGEP